MGRSIPSLENEICPEMLLNPVPMESMTFCQENRMSINKTDKVKEFEWARRILKREQKEPSAYTRNRKEAVIERVYKLEGEKAAREIIKEFKKL